jgi:hypothetical protein
MLGRKQCIESMRHEIRIIRHLATKVPPGQLDWRPAPVQRSLRELLQYLTTCALIPAVFIRDGRWDAAEKLEEEAGKLDPKDFDAAMEREEKALVAIVEGFSDAAMEERPTAMPWGTPCMTGEGFVNMCLKTLVAYRMQLFLYAKQSGNHDLGPANCWVGVDAPKKPA